MYRTHPGSTLTHNTFPYTTLYRSAGYSVLTCGPWHSRVNQGRHGHTYRVLLCRGRLESWRIGFAKQSQKDARNLTSAGLKEKAELLLAVLAENPFRTPPPYEQLVGDLAGAYSRRINIQHRLVYQVLDAERTVNVLRMWTRYA